MQPLSVAQTIAFTARFIVQNFVPIVLRIFLPAVAGWAVLYFSFSAYLSELIQYLAAPSDRVGSLVLGLATGGLMTALFFHAVIAAAVAALALGDKDDRGWIYLRAARREWRLYAATLRVVAVGFAFVIVVFVAELLLRNMISTGTMTLWFKIITVVGLFAIFVRLGFLLPAVSVAIEDGPVVRRAWRFSRGRAALISITTILFVLLGLAVQFGGEYVMRAAALAPSHSQTLYLIDVARMFQKFLPEFLLVLSLAYLITSIALTVFAVCVYRALNDESRADIA